MQLKKIDKQRYRRHLNLVIVGAILALIVGSLAISQTLIALFPNPSGSHFNWNLLGVITAAIAIAFVLHKIRSHPFLNEVTYIWDLKQALNKINRKITKLKAAAEQGNINAMQALHYSYAGSRLLWELDDNTIIMDELLVQQAELNSLAEKHKVSLNTNDYDEGILKSV